MQFRNRLALASALLLSVLAGRSESQTIRVDVQLSQIVVTVTDARGRYVTDLGQNDFTVEVDRVPQKIAHFSQDSDTPVTLGLVMDVSGSMSAELRSARQAARTFIHGMRPEDEFFLMTFASSSDLLQNLTHDRAQMEKALGEVDAARGSTHLLTSVVKAAAVARKGVNRKRAIVVITDGSDNECRLTVEDFQEKLRSAEMLAYGIRLPIHMTGAPVMSGTIPIGRGDPCRKMHGANEFFETLANETGGRTFSLQTNSRTFDIDLDNIFAEITAELRGQYTIGFYPTKSGEGLIQVRTTHPDYKVRTQRRALQK